MALAEDSLNFTSKTAAEYWIIELRQQWVVHSSKIEDEDGWWVATVTFAVKDGALVPATDG